LRRVVVRVLRSEDSLGGLDLHRHEQGFNLSPKLRAVIRLPPDSQFLPG
jgi:hypothetical protein